MVDEIRELLTRHRPGYEVRSVVRLGSGLDNLVYEVNGELLVRYGMEAGTAKRGETVRREATLLTVLRDLSPIPVPEPAFVDIDAGVLAYAKLRGHPLAEQPVADPGRLAAELAEFLSRLHEAPLGRMSTLVPNDVEPLAMWLRDAEECYGRIRHVVPAATRPAIESFLTAVTPAEPRKVAFCHNDLGAEHVLVDPETGTVTGVIDWTDAAITDPAYDLGLLYRDLGPDVLELVLAAYSNTLDDAGVERIAFYARCAVLEDIDYGVTSGARRYADAGLAHLEWLFS